jgi:hypothetical protein
MDSSQLIRIRQARVVFSDYTAQQQTIAQGCGKTESVYAFRAIPSGNRTDILIGEFNTSPAEVTAILDSGNANCSGVTPAPPLPDTTIVADLNGLNFLPLGAGSSFFSTFTFAATNTITVGFYNANLTINNISHIDFRTAPPMPILSPSDTYTIANPTYTTPTEYVAYGPGDIYSQVYQNDVFNLNSNSIITFVTTTPITSIGFSVN